MFEFIRNNKYKFTLALIITFVIIVQLTPHFVNNYSYPRGGDAAQHINFANQVIQTGTTANLEYLPGFSIFTSSLSLITGISTTKIFIFSLIGTFCLVILSLYVVTKKIFGQRAALFAIVVLSLISVHPRWYLEDSTIVNVITVFFLMPLFLFYLNEFINNSQKQYLVIVLILFSAISIYHTVGFIYSITIATIFLIFIILYKSIKEKSFKKIIRPLLALSTIIITALITAPRMIFEYFGPILISRVPFLSNFLHTDVYKDEISINGIPIIEPLAAQQFYNFIGHTVWIIFFLSIPVFLYLFKTHKNILVLLSIWLILLLIGARTNLGIEAERFTRDLVLPLIIIGSLFSFYFSKQFAGHKNIIIVLFIVSLMLVNLPNILQRDILANESIVHPLDSQAIVWILSQEKNPKILLAPGMKTRNDLPGPFDLTYPQTQFFASNCESEEILQPGLQSSKNFYKNNEIDFIYYRNKEVTWFPNYQHCDWKYDKKIEKTEFIEMVKSFYDDKIKIKIYKINRNKLQ